MWCSHFITKNGDYIKKHWTVWGFSNIDHQTKGIHHRMTFLTHKPTEMGSSDPSRFWRIQSGNGWPNTSSGWWFQTCFIVHFIHGMILPIDELIFFRGVGIPPTSHRWWFWRNKRIINGKFGILKMEVLYHIRPYFVGIFPYIGFKNRPYIW